MQLRRSRPRLRNTISGNTMQQTAFAEYHKREYDAMVEKYKTAALEEWRAKNHPFRNLWAWVKRRLGCKV